MRPSRREQILDAAFDLIGREGFAAVSFESVARAAAVTKSGLVYHFPSTDSLLLALHEHQAAKWEASMVAALDGDVGSATADERLAAYTRVAVRRAVGADLLLMVEASVRPEFRRPWDDVTERWLPDLTDVDPADPTAMVQLLAILAADGLWVSDAIGDLRLPDPLRAALVERIVDSLTGTASIDHR